MVMRAGVLRARLHRFGVVDAGAGGVVPTTLDPTQASPDINLSPDHLSAFRVNAGVAFRSARSVASVGSGLYHVEAFKATAGSTNGVGIGLCNSSMTFADFVGDNANSIGILSGFTTIWANGGSVGNIDATWNAINNAVDMELDATPSARLVWFRTRGGQWNASGAANPATGVGGIALPAALQTGALFVGVTATDPSAPDTITCNFGATTFGDTPSTGFGTFG